MEAPWAGRVPKLHYSEQDPAKRFGTHSAYVEAGRFQRFTASIPLTDASIPLTDHDVMLESKAKEQALLRLRGSRAYIRRRRRDARAVNSAIRPRPSNPVLPVLREH